MVHNNCEQSHMENVWLIAVRGMVKTKKVNGNNSRNVYTPFKYCYILILCPCVCMSIWMCMFVFMCVCVCVCICVSIWVSMCVCPCICVSVCVCVCDFAYANACVYLCTQSVIHSQKIFIYFTDDFATFIWKAFSPALLRAS